MIIESSFLNVKFTEITLLHILILLGGPYLIFYVFEKITKFDKFIEKWEGALFMFSIGGVITFLSLLFSSISNYSFYVFYSVFLIYLIMGLFILKKIHFSKKDIGWILIKIDCGERYKGKYAGGNNQYLKIKRSISEKMLKIYPDENKKELDAKEMLIKRSLINSVFYYD